MNNKENHIKKLSVLCKRSNKIHQTLLDNYVDLIKDNNISPLLGGYGHGTEMVAIKLTHREFCKFKVFCEKNDFKFSILSEYPDYKIITCKKQIYYLYVR